MNTILVGDSLEQLRTLPDEFVNMAVTSPPYYGLRDYGKAGQIGLEETPEAYISRLVEVFREVRRVLKADGTLWVNIGDSYAVKRSSGHSPTNTRNKGGHVGGMNRTADGLKTKDLIGIPWMLAFALRADGWYLRSDIIWHKPNAMPESVKDRPTKAHEYIFLLSKSPRYYYDAESVKEQATNRAPGNKRHKFVEQYNADDSERFRTKVGLSNIGAAEYRNRRTVWSIATKPFKGAHFAVFPPDLVEPCILAGCPVGGIVLDPFFGSGTTGLVANRNGRKYIGVELNEEYAEIARQRIGEASA